MTTTEYEMQATHLRRKLAEAEQKLRMLKEDGRVTDAERRVLDMWPRFEDGEPVMPGSKTAECGEVSRVCVTYKTAYFNESHRKDLVRHPHGERVKRPAPEVLDADGAPIRVGDTVWLSESADKGLMIAPPLKVEGFAPSGNVELLDRVDIDSGTSEPWFLKPGWLTHREPDSWEKLEEDAKKVVCEYFGREWCKCDGCPAFELGNCSDAISLDIVRRAKALAGIEVE